MANLESIVSKKTAEDAQWKEQRQMERENAVGLRDAGITEITSTAEVYAKYLEMQGDNPTYSAGNIALVMFDTPETTIFGTADRWRALGRTVLAGERNKGAKIFARATFPNRGYALADAYDVKQTQGRAVKETHLRNESKEMEAALTTLLNYSPVPVETNGELNCAALYDPARMTLVINPACLDNEAFSAIASEIAQARFHARGSNQFYSYEDSRLDAESVSYILCRRFGVERDMPDTSHVAELYEGWNTDQRAEALNRIHDMAKQIGGSIERDISPQQQRGRTPPPRASR